MKMDAARQERRMDQYSSVSRDTAFWLAKRRDFASQFFWDPSCHLYRDIRASSYGISRPNREVNSLLGFFRGLECMDLYTHAFLCSNEVIFKYRINFTFVITSYGQFEQI
jgi:hypothetical protein